jgi:two-component system response regulator
VEDNADDVDLSLIAFERAGLSAQVVVARDGVEALDYLYREGKYAERSPGMPRLVLLDLKMPRMDGLQVLARLKRDERTQALPVVMLTSSREEGDLLGSYELGANSYVVKPVDFDQFAETVAQVGLYWAVVNQVPG